YTVEYGAGTVINVVEYGRQYRIEGEDDIQTAYYDIGLNPNPGQTISVRAELENKGKYALENAAVYFEAEKDGQIVAIGTSDPIASLLPGEVRYAYEDFITQGDVVDTSGAAIEVLGGTWTLRAYLVEGETRNDRISKETTLIINSNPIAMAADIADAMAGEPTYFDASRSYDPDGYLVSYLWDFGDGSSANGLTASHTFLSGGSRTVTLTVTDNNLTEDSLELMVTVEDDRPDLKIANPAISGDPMAAVKFFKDGAEVARNALAEGDVVTVRATMYNEPNSAGAADPNDPMASKAVESDFYVGFYVDYQYKGYKTVEVTSTSAIAMGGTKVVEFTWTVPAGNHIVTIIANDIGKMIDERNHDNNRLDVQVGAGQIYFPDLKAMTTQ
ncbi:MAG: PKD domain-containing protein, partial [Synergistaceae bacterium]|nr:PKD domain-containing protein [Synergistaceae bacterium]